MREVSRLRLECLRGGILSRRRRGGAEEEGGEDKKKVVREGNGLDFNGDRGTI